MKKTFDISKCSVDETTTVNIETPDGETMENGDGEKVSITVFGPGSKPYQKAQAVKNRAILDQLRKGKNKMSDSLQRELDAEFLATCTSSFNNFSYKDFEPGYAMFKACYMDYSIGFVAEQVNNKIGDWANFTKA